MTTNEDRESAVYWVLIDDENEGIDLLDLAVKCVKAADEADDSVRVPRQSVEIALKVLDALQYEQTANVLRDILSR